MRVRILPAFFALLLFSPALWAQVRAQASTLWNTPNPWVDSVYNSLTEDERIAQLFMIAAWPNKDSSHIREVDCLIKEQKVGGIIFFKGAPVRQAAFTNYFQSVSKIPLLIGIDGEWGLSMRLDSTPTFPRQMMLGAAQNDSLVYRMGKEIGKHCRRIGIHMNFAPVVDVNNNPRNPVINDRSFGEDKYEVARLGIAYSRGMQSEKVLACAKHFPGHGDTDSDSHFSLPLIKKSRAELDTLELFPFRALFNDGVMSVMNAHLFIPALDSTPNLASSLSKNVVTGLLKTDMGFQGLVLTDALNMQGVSRFNATWDINIKSLKAGNDILLLAEDVPYSIMKIKETMLTGELDSNAIMTSVKKVLLCKYWAGLNNYKPIDLNNLTADLNCCSTDLLIHEVVERSVLVARNSDGLIPLRRPEQKRIALVAVGTREYRTFEEVALSYARMDRFFIDKTDPENIYRQTLDTLKSYDLVIVSLHNTSRYVSKNFGMNEQQVRFVNRLNQQSKMILVNNGNPYSMQLFPDIRSLIISFEDQPWNNEVAAQILFGAKKAEGKMPVSVGNYALHTSDTGGLTGRFEYLLPEQAGFDHTALANIDTLVNRAIAAKATPGCQVLVAKNGKIIYHKAIGQQTYAGAPVREDQLYDLASLTKMLSTTLAVMKLHERHQIDLDRKISHYIPELRETNKRAITVRQLLLHEAGLPPFIPFYKKTLVNGRLNPMLYTEKRDEEHTVQVAENLWLHKDYQDLVWDEIMACEIKKDQGYVYSDLSFILLKKAIENITEVPLNQYVDSVFYKPLGLATMGYLPLKRFPAADIVPTELDSSFRMQLLRGYVHDPGAALMGGVAGHAGLFANASDVAVVMQMLLNKGEYAGTRIFKPAIVDEFTNRASKTSRRGLGFDKPETDPAKATPCGKNVSRFTFGHTGFTGTCAWADPQNGLVYVFLSNRIHPDAENKKLLDMNVRTAIHDLIYEVVK